MKFKMNLIKKQTLLIFALLIIAALVVMMFKNKSLKESHTLKNSDYSFQPTTIKHGVTKISNNNHVGNMDAKKAKSIEENKMSPTDWRIFTSWLDEHGYPDKEDLKIYESYSEETLNKLAENGDLLALRVLTNDRIKKGDIKSALKFTKQSAIYGSTAALDSMVILTAPSYEDNTEEKRRTALLETFAIVRLMVLRGNRSLADVSARGVLMKYERDNGEVTLTSEEKILVETRAQEIYTEFQQERYKLGLGDFDNDEPFSIKKFFGLE